MSTSDDFEDTMSDWQRTLELDAVMQAVENGDVDAVHVDWYIAEVLSKCGRCSSCAQAAECEQPLSIDADTVTWWREQAEAAASAHERERAVVQLRRRLAALDPCDQGRIILDMLQLNGWDEKEFAVGILQRHGLGKPRRARAGRPPVSKYDLEDIERRIAAAREKLRARGERKHNRTAGIESIARAEFGIEPKSLKGVISKLKAKQP